MGILLSDNDKMIILIVAALIILITFLLTICFVSENCYLYKWLLKAKPEKKQIIIKPTYPIINQNGESKHFQLSISSVYGTKNQSFSEQSQTINDKFEHLINLAEKARIRYSVPNNENAINNNKKRSLENVPENYPKLELFICYQPITNSTIKICINIKRVCNLFLENIIGTEPSPYVICTLLSNYRAHKATIIIKATQMELFRTETIKRTNEAIYAEKIFISEELPKNLIKEGSIKFRLFHDERYANDICFGELIIPLKRIQSFPFMSIDEAIEPMKELNNNKNNIVQSIENGHSIQLANNTDDHLKTSVYTMFPIKEIKGDLLVGFCYLPTSRRVNITIIKGNVRNATLKTITDSINHLAYYAKSLMFANGRLVKKKKSALSVSLNWGKDETISMDLPEDEPLENMSLMLILAFKKQNLTSPESPDLPDNNQLIDNDTSNQQPVFTELAQNSSQTTRINKNNNSFVQKKCCVGHFVLDQNTWMEKILMKPRNQILKWYKLY